MQKRTKLNMQIEKYIKCRRNQLMKTDKIENEMEKAK